MRKNLLVWILPTCVALHLVTGTARAQTAPDGSVRGQVTDHQNLTLSGVTLTLRSPTSATPLTAVTSDDGSFRILNVPPGTYTLVAELSGFSRYVRETVVVRAGLNLTLDLVMTVGAVTETLEVSAEPPLLDATSAVHAINVSGELQRSLPLSTRRNWSDFLSLTPGIVSVEQSAVGATFFANGADFGSHVIQLDGADIASGVQSSNLYLYMSPEILADVQIKTGGVDASAPLGQGAVINMVTRSGTNHLKGSGTMLFQAERWSANNNPGGTTSAFQLTQPEVAVGGPVIPDRSWFFGTYRYSAMDEGISRTPANLDAARAFVPSFQPFGDEVLSQQTFIKSTTQLSDRQRVEVFHQYGIDQDWVLGPEDTVRSRRATTGGHAFSARLLSTRGSSLSTRLGISYSNQSNHDRLEIDDRPGRQMYEQVVPAAGGLAGVGLLTVLDNYRSGLSQDALSSKPTVTFDATYYRAGWAGSHELQAGAYLQPRRLSGFTVNYANDGFAFEEVVLRNPADLTAGFVPFHRRIYDEASAPFSNVNSEDYAVYLQDTWRPMSRVTITAGVRADWIHRRDRLFDDVVQDTLAVGPRVGINYALTDERRDIIRASFNRLHQAVSSGAGVTAGRNSAGFVDLFDTDLDGVFETVLETPPVTQRTLNRVIDLDEYRQPHANEFTLGYRRQLFGQMSVDLSLVRREYRDLQTVVEINGIYEGGVFKGYRDEEFNDLNRLTSNVYNWPVYTAIELLVAKETTALQIMASYTRQWRHIAGTWQPNDPASFIQPDAFPNNRGIGNVTSTTSPPFSSLSGTAQTNGQQWRDHVMRIAASLGMPADIRVSGNFTIQTGVWSGPITTRTEPDLRFGPETVTLSDGRVVSNPLATPVRFAFATRADGQLKTPLFSTLSLRLSRAFTVGRLHVEPALDFFNVTNHDADQLLAFGANQLDSPNYADTSARQLPRSAQISIRVTF